MIRVCPSMEPPVKICSYCEHSFDSRLVRCPACGYANRKDVSIGYPDDYIIVSLEHVRAADDIRISYDFERDGWVIEQASVFEWSEDLTMNDDDECDPCWAEVAFVGAWGREKTPIGGL